jgi:hypothetical protein
MPVNGFGSFVWGVNKTDELGVALHKKSPFLCRPELTSLCKSVIHNHRSTN